MNPSSPAPRIALIHATPLAVAPVEIAFDRHWPQARRMNLLDDSLAADRAEAGELSPAMVDRFRQLAGYAASTGCAGILFTCSAFGDAIDAAAAHVGLPTLKPNEAMFEAALAASRDGRSARLALVATFQASLPSMAAEIEALAAARGIALDLRTVFVPEAMHALGAGRVEEHHSRIAEAAKDCGDRDAVLLAQFSMADAAARVRAKLVCPVLTSPDCAVLALKSRVGAPPAPSA
ncbi:aspartate/glutamate racemase family protein [Ramlibacter sp.]|uniref:aspartate/glutamate racemase family protein n=1 Tax=Ramlibacter sp. TaxID=1917967 RepID=UPI003D0F22FB